jgi:ABC-type uncharacterized transport system substrate-binding protein
MKKIFLSSMCLALIISLILTNLLFAGSKNLKIAMIQWRGETEACRGFKTGLKELGYSVQYTVMNAGQDRKELGRLLRKDLEPQLYNFDYIYSYGTTASKMTKSIVNDRVPQLFSNVAAPVESDIVPSMESSGGNISGTSNRVPLTLQIGTALKIIHFKRLGLFFNPREKNAMVIRNELYAIAKDFGFEVIDLRSPPVQDSLEKNLQKLIDKSIVVDAVYLPLDSFLLTKAELISTKLRAAKIKSIAAQKKYIQNGALLGVIPDYYKLGKVVATILDRHQKGIKLQNIPIQTPKESIVVINKSSSDELNINIPEAFLKKAIIVE